MQIEIKIDPAFTEPKLTLLTDRVTPEIEELLKRLSAPAQPLLAGFRDGGAALIDSARIFRIYAAAGKVFAVTDAGEYTLRLRLYELEDRLDRQSFVRISNSEIINLRKAVKFDLSLAGTICVSLGDGFAAYVSRRMFPPSGRHWVFVRPYAARWMPHDAQGMLTYVGIFVAVYVVIWLSQYSAMKARIRQINEKIKGEP